MSKKGEEIILVKGTQKLADQYKVKSPPSIVVVDPEGQEIHRASFRDARTLDAALEAALKKYSNAPVPWTSELKAGAGKLLVVGFDDEKGEGLKVLEDRTLVLYHGKCTFVKFPYEKEGELARKWGVHQAPTIYLCDPSKENPERNPLEKLSGKKSPREAKAALLKALRKLEEKK